MLIATWVLTIIIVYPGHNIETLAIDGMTEESCKIAKKKWDARTDLNRSTVYPLITYADCINKK